MKILTVIGGAVLIIILLSLTICMLYPSETEEELVQDWVESGQAKAIVDGEEIPIKSIEPQNFTHVLLIDENGNVFAIIPIDELNQAAERNQPVPARKHTGGSSTPAPTPTPTPTPGIPIPTPTPVNVTVPNPPPPTNTTPGAPSPTPSPAPVPTQPVCGNNIVETGEQCDDGNLISQDGCSSTCVSEFCGDNVLQTMMLEQCEPPNTATCDANCQIISGGGGGTPPSPGLPAHCTNSIWDGDESDQDCGGSCFNCPPLGFPTYISCWENSDCASNTCTGTAPLPIIYGATTYNSYSQIRVLAGDLNIIQFQGTC